MAVTVKPEDLSPQFLKRVEGRYGKIHPNDFFSANLGTYYKFDPSYKSEGGGKTHKVLPLASFIDLYKNLGQSKNSAKSLKTKPELRGDKEYQTQADKVINTFNSFRTFFRKNYPDQYSLVKNSIKEIEGMGYNTPFAFKKKGSSANISQYLKMGYKPVNQKALRKKSKGFEFIDLYKD